MTLDKLEVESNNMTEAYKSLCEINTQLVCVCGGLPSSTIQGYGDMYTKESLINFLLPITDKFVDMKHIADLKNGEMWTQARLEEVERQ